MKEGGSLEGALSPFEEAIRLPILNAFASWAKGNKKQGESQIRRRQTCPQNPCGQIEDKIAKNGSV